VNAIDELLLNGELPAQERLHEGLCPEGGPRVVTGADRILYGSALPVPPRRAEANLAPLDVLEPPQQPAELGVEPGVAQCLLHLGCHRLSEACPSAAPKIADRHPRRPFHHLRPEVVEHLDFALGLPDRIDRVARSPFAPRCAAGPQHCRPHRGVPVFPGFAVEELVHAVRLMYRFISVKCPDLSSISRP
jgi:hypothetical protein